MNDLLQSSSFMPYFTLEHNWLWSFQVNTRGSPTYGVYTTEYIPLLLFVAHVQTGNFSISI